MSDKESVPHRRPTRRDAIAALIAGSALGLPLLGFCGRIGMRIVAVSNGQAPIFTPEGTVAVTLLGGLAGAGVALIFLLARVVFPVWRIPRLLLFWALNLFVVLRGIHPVTAVNASVFLPLFLTHGVLLHVFWCRVHLPRDLHIRGAYPNL